MRVLGFVVASCWSLVALAGPASSPVVDSKAADTRAVIIGNLSWIDSKPDPKVAKDNEAVWSPVLLQLVNDPTASPRVRQRALTTLQYYDRPEVAAFFREVATDTTREPKLRARAIRCLALREGVGSLATLTGLLADPEPRVRKDTLRALASLGVPGRAPIRAHLDREPLPHLRALALQLLGPDVAPTPMSR